MRRRCQRNLVFRSGHCHRLANKFAKPFAPTLRLQERQRAATPTIQPPVQRFEQSPPLGGRKLAVDQPVEQDIVVEEFFVHTYLIIDGLGPGSDRPPPAPFASFAAPGAAGLPPRWC